MGNEFNYHKPQSWKHSVAHTCKKKLKPPQSSLENTLPDRVERKYVLCLKCNRYVNRQEASDIFTYPNRKKVTY